MASMLKFDSERREMRRERHQARVARKRERQQARQLKHAHQDDVVRVPRVTVGPPTPRPVVDAAPPTPITLAEPEVAPTNPISVAESDVAPESQRPLTDGPEAGECKPFVAQRERDVAAFLTRREAVIAQAPWSAVRGARAERAGAPSPTGAGWRRAFWR